MHRRELEAKCKSKDAKLSVLLKGSTRECLGIAELYQSISTNNQILSQSEKKVSRYERYIQQNMRDRR